MIQNLKVDIIYHLTPSDFEMEFNMCGCCRMRLLNDKTTDKKSFIKSLARAVSRSRVIMVCGPLFSENGIISTVATAIGSRTVLCDNAAYGIAGDDKIEIIEGSTPLVTPDGYFGGCIIESGPQTIILLTENRSFRKVIMQNLIHPYIEEISYIPQKSAPVQASPQEAEPISAVSENENYITEPDSDYNNEIELQENAYEAPAAADEHNIEFVMDSSPEDEEQNDTDDTLFQTPNGDLSNSMYTAVETAEEIKERYENAYVPSESDNMFITTSGYEDDDPQIKPKKENSKAMDISIVVLSLLLLLAVLALVYFVIVKPYTLGISTADYLKEIFGASSGSSLI